MHTKIVYCLNNLKLEKAKKRWNCGYPPIETTHLVASSTDSSEAWCAVLGETRVTTPGGRLLSRVHNAPTKRVWFSSVTFRGIIHLKGYVRRPVGYRIRACVSSASVQTTAPARRIIAISFWYITNQVQLVCHRRWLCARFSGAWFGTSGRSSGEVLLFFFVSQC